MGRHESEIIPTPGGGCDIGCAILVLILLTVFAGLIYYAYGTYGKVTKSEDASKTLVSMYMQNTELSTARKIAAAMANPKTQANVIATAQQWGNFTLEEQKNTQYIGQPYTEYRPPKSSDCSSNSGSDSKSMEMNVESAEISKMLKVIDMEEDLIKAFMGSTIDDSLVPGSQTLSNIDLPKK